MGPWRTTYCRNLSYVQSNTGFVQEPVRGSLCARLLNSSTKPRGRTVDPKFLGKCLRYSTIEQFRRPCRLPRLSAIIFVHCTDITRVGSDGRARARLYMTANNSMGGIEG